MGQKDVETWKGMQRQWNVEIVRQEGCGNVGRDSELMESRDSGTRRVWKCGEGCGGDGM